MAGEKYGDKAIASLLSFFSGGFPAALAAVETAQGLAAGYLPRPDEYVDSRRADDADVKMLIYIESTTDIEGGVGMLQHDCTVAYHFSSDADIDNGEPILRKVFTAVKDLIDSDNNLGGGVTSAILSDGDYAAARTTTNATRHAVAVGVRVVTDDGC